MAGSMDIFLPSKFVMRGLLAILLLQSSLRQVRSVLAGFSQFVTTGSLSILAGFSKLVTTGSLAILLLSKFVTTGTRFVGHSGWIFKVHYDRFSAFKVRYDRFVGHSAAFKVRYDKFVCHSGCIFKVRYNSSLLKVR
jgi:hypothetical protein